MVELVVWKQGRSFEGECGEVVRGAARIPTDSTAPGVEEDQPTTGFGRGDEHVAEEQVAMHEVQGV